MGIEDPSLQPVAHMGRDFVHLFSLPELALARTEPRNTPSLHLSEGHRPT
jgi:hypothetical protein